MAVYIAGLGISATLRTQGDFNVYYRAGHRVLHGLAIYPPTDSDRFLYAPIVAIGLAPLAALPRRLAQFVFFAFNAFALIEFVIGTGILLFGRERRLPATLIVVPVLLAFRFVGNNIEHGQITLIALALLTLTVVYAEESRDSFAGLMLAAALLMKPFSVLFALYLALRGKFRTLAWTAIWIAALLLAPIVVFGVQGWIDQTSAYFVAIASMTGRYQTMLTNQSAVSAVARLMSLGTIAPETSSIPMLIGLGFEAALVAAVLIWDFYGRAQGGFAGRLALCALFCVTASMVPISWKSYFAVLIVPYMALTAALWTYHDERDTPRILVWCLFVLSVLLNLAPGNYLNRLMLFYSAHFVSSLLAIAALFALWMRSGELREPA